MKTHNPPDNVTAAVCSWLLSGGEDGTYPGTVPGPSHDLSALLSRETGTKEVVLYFSAAWIRLDEALRPVLESLHAEDAVVWAVKGFDLARSVYPFPGARPMSDVDLYVEKKHLSVVLDRFNRAGWSRFSPGDGIFGADIVSEMKLEKNGILVELHTHMFYFPAVFPGRMPSDLFQTGRSLQPGLMGISWHNALLAVIVHMIINEFIRPVWWIDAFLLCGKISETGNWKPFFRNACATNLGNPIADILRTARSVLGAPVPDHVIEGLEGSGRGRDKIVRRLKSGRKIPSLLNLEYLTGWKRISWFFALLWLLLSRQHPLRR